MNLKELYKSIHYPDSRTVMKTSAVVLIAMTVISGMIFAIDTAAVKLISLF